MVKSRERVISIRVETNPSALEVDFMEKFVLFLINQHGCNSRAQAKRKTRTVMNKIELESLPRVMDLIEDSRVYLGHCPSLHTTWQPHS